MNKNIIRFISRSLSVVLATTLIITGSSVDVQANNNNIDVHADNNISDPVIMVSLGDSFSSGEGIEDFYGQYKELSEKVKDEDWLAHRSVNSWPSLLKINGIDGTMRDYKYKRGQDTNCEWYFAASSGATTKHINGKKQKKPYNKGSNLKDDYYLPKQLTIFDDIEYGTVDYVTLTIGGNDVGFAKIIEDCVKGSTYIGSKPLNERLNDAWDEMDTTKANIKKVYTDICDAAGGQAEIIVAGYPKLLKKYLGHGITEQEVYLINSSVTRFNRELKNIVNECRNSGMNIHFVDVESEFDGHEAYSDNSWINPIIFGAREQDLKNVLLTSAYSIHPDERGAQAYARCVNAKIEEIEIEKSNKKEGTLSGKICKAIDRVSPISDATISVYKDNSTSKYIEVSPNNSGNYALSLPVGEYRIEISADGYIDFTSYATVTEDENNYMETFLLVTGSPSETGIASGTINNALTGRGVEGVSLSIRKGWNNTENGEIISTAVTDSNGKYSVALPLGNYTMLAEKSGYISGIVNIIVQSGRTDSQNGTIAPTISGDNFRIVLTWGQNPSDLDSHVVGTLSQGSPFHVYYGSKSVYDGDVEVCNLDVDDTSSYGPETITLNTSTSNNPFYYYIYKYSGSGTVATSEAKINVYQGADLVATFNVPTDQGDGRYWNVFAIVNGKLVINNTITDSANVSYANVVPLSLQDEILDTEAKEEETINKEILDTEAKEEETINKEILDTEAKEEETINKEIPDTEAKEEETINKEIPDTEPKEEETINKEIPVEEYTVTETEM